MQAVVYDDAEHRDAAKGIEPGHFAFQQWGAERLRGE
jgi:hypothetical protein